MALLLALILLFSSELPAAGSFPDDHAANRDARIATAVQFREKFGLRNADAYVAELDANRSDYQSSIEKWGAPLTSEELGDLARRQQISNAVPIVESYVRREAPSEFAGIYIDQLAGGVVRVGFTERADEHYGALRALFPFPKQLDVFDAVNSADSLKALAEDASLLLGEFGIHSVSIVVEANRVELGVLESTDQLRQELEERFPDEPLFIVEQPISVFTSHYQDYPRTPPMVGALRIDERDALGQIRAACSAAFNVRAIGTSNSFATTAGHCGRPGRTWWHGGNSIVGRYEIGDGATNAYYGQGGVSRADAQRIALRDDHATNRILTGGGEQVIASVEKRDEVNEGDTVCRSGYRSESELGTGVVCGTVTRTNEDVFICDVNFANCVSLPNQVRANFPSCFGDSGGPVYRGVTAKGIVSTARNFDGACGSSTTYAHISAVESQLDVKVRVSP